MQVYLDIFIIWRRLLEYVIIFFYRRHHREWGGYKDILALGEDMSCHTNEEERDLCMSCNNHAPCSVCFTHPLGSLFSIFFLSPSQLSIWWSAFLLSLYIEIQRRKVWGGDDVLNFLDARPCALIHSIVDTFFSVMLYMQHEHADDTLRTLQMCWGFFFSHSLSPACAVRHTRETCVDYSRSLSTRRRRSFTNGVLLYGILIIISLCHLLYVIPLIIMLDDADFQISCLIYSASMLTHHCTSC